MRARVGWSKYMLGQYASICNAMERSSFFPPPFPESLRRFMTMSSGFPVSTNLYALSCEHMSSWVPVALDTKVDAKRMCPERSSCCVAKRIDSFVSYVVTTPMRCAVVESPDKCLIGALAEHIEATLLAPTQPPARRHAFDQNDVREQNAYKTHETHQSSAR